MRTAIGAIFIAGVSIWCAADAGAETITDKAKNDQIKLVPKDDPAMAAAFQRAWSTLDDFLAIARNPRPTITSMAMKVAVRDGDDTEFFWVGPFAEKGDHFVGRINNTPRYVHNVILGQAVAFDKSNIVDWLYRENGKMIGNFTACVLLKNEPAAEVENFKKQYGLACDP